MNKTPLRLCRWFMAIIGILGASQAQSTAVVLYGAQQFVLHSRFTGQQYTIYLSVPAVPPPQGGYPVLYALDGDASFPPLHLANPRQASVFAMQAQHLATVPDPGVVVGIGYGKDFYQTFSERTRDYTPASQETSQQNPSGGSGGAAAFARFIAEELKPAIAARLPVNPARQSLLGHSYGGLFTLYQLLTGPQAFQRYFAISPSIWFGDGALRQLPLPKNLTGMLTIWVGGDEEPALTEGTPIPPQLERLILRQQKNRMISNARALVTQLRQSSGLVIDFRVVAAHDHGEMAAYAYDRVLTSAFSPTEPAQTPPLKKQ
jgi:predicted alpha/beta superfamily hydrolase